MGTSNPHPPTETASRLERYLSSTLHLSPPLLSNLNPQLTPPESNPETHDLAIPLPGPGPISNPPLLRFILLSPSDIPHPQTLPRLERLSHQDPTHRCAIILLLSGHDSMTALSNLQISLLTSSLSIPILPLTTPSELPSLLEDFYKKLVSIKPAHQCNPKLEAQQLLPYTALHPPLGSHPVNVLGDINSSLGDLVDKISTPQGRTILADYCPEVCGRVVGFWTGQG